MYQKVSKKVGVTRTVVIMAIHRYQDHRRMLQAVLSYTTKYGFGLLSLVATLLVLGCSKSEQPEVTSNSPFSTQPVAQPTSEDIDELAPVLEQSVVTPPMVTRPAVTRPVEQSTPLSVPAGPKLAIIIDDIGYNANTGLRAANLPSTITLSVLPFSPNGANLAKKANLNGKEIMLHSPMSTIGDRPLDEGGLDESMSQSEFVQTLYDSLDTLGDVKGVNNHMGSLLTQKEEQMSWLMDALKARALYFVDSRTSPDSRAYEVAQITDLPSAKRDVFLDNERSVEAITEQLKEALRNAQRNGQAVAIGHPYPETMTVLETLLPALAEEQGVTLVPVSHIVDSPHATLLSMHNNDKNLPTKREITPKL